MGQSFTIRRPAEGSTVRETVQILIPSGAIAREQYVGIVVNGKFLEAAMPPLEGDNYVYRLDTKGRRIPDGDLDIELILYQNFNERAEIVNRSSVRVKLDNYTSIKVPEDGLELRYKFRKGQELVYRTVESQTIGTVSQAAAQLGSRSGEIPLGSEEVRTLYAFDNVYDTPTGPEALLRLQALPEKGKNYAWITTTGETEAKKFYDYQMHPLYMRITDVGREVWGAAPPYFPLEGTNGDPARTDLYHIFPLPVLPSKKLYPGDSWQAQQLFGHLDMDKLPETNKLTTGLISRGTFIGVEWEKGIPCAKFSVAVDAGPRDIVNAVNLNNQPGEATRVTLEGTIWFALDRGVIVKSEVNMLQESLVTVGGGSSTTGGGTGPAGSGTGPGGKNLPGGFGPTGGGGGGGVAGPPGGMFDIRPWVDEGGYLHIFQGRGTRGGIGGAPTGGGNTLGGTGGPGIDGRTGGGSGGEQKMILRVRVRLLTELER